MVSGCKFLVAKEEKKISSEKTKCCRGEVRLESLCCLGVRLGKLEIAGEAKDAFTYVLQQSSTYCRLRGRRAAAICASPSEME